MTRPDDQPPASADERRALLPCPFCCGQPTMVNRGGDLFVFRCPETSPCFGSGMATYGQRSRRDEAIAAWNTRLAAERQPYTFAPVEGETWDGVTQGGWQPIETAPRDGTTILGSRTDWHDHCCKIWWDVTAGVDGDWSGAAGRFTHWMPLPAAPANGGSHE